MYVAGEGSGRVLDPSLPFPKMGDTGNIPLHLFIVTISYSARPDEIQPVIINPLTDILPRSTHGFTSSTGFNET